MLALSGERGSAGSRSDVQRHRSRWCGENCEKFARKYFIVVMSKLLLFLYVCDEGKRLLLPHLPRKIFVLIKKQNVVVFI